MRSWCVTVPRDKGESVRKKLLELGLLDHSLKIRSEEGSVLIPILAPGTGGLAEEFGSELTHEEFEERKVHERDYRKVVKIPPGLANLLPSSYDVVGDVAVIRLPPELLPFRSEVGEALKATFPRLRTVAVDRGVQGALRIRNLEIIAGENDTSTIHVEYGLRFKVDLSRMYFNPRLGSERMRIASLVRKGEVVIDMFAGVGPFSLMIAKYAQPERVYAIDLNKDAIDSLRVNMIMNHVHRVVPMLGDAREIIKGLPQADRVIMNLPHSAHEFFEDALSRLKPGGTLHMYFVAGKPGAADFIETLKRKASVMSKVITVLRCEELKTYSPTTSVFSLDLALANGA